MQAIATTRNDSATLESTVLLALDALPLIRQRLLSAHRVQAEHAMPLSYVQALAALSETGSLSVSELSKRLGIAKPNITPMVDQLTALGLVERVRDDVDRRFVNIELLPAGREKLAAITRTITYGMIAWGMALPRGSTELHELNRALATIVRIVA